MSSRLTDNLHPIYRGAYSGLIPQQSNERVLVYVESDEDIAFWNYILSPFGKKHNLDFDIQNPNQNGLEKGKTAVLKFFPNVGSHLILCVDSDYDYLRQSATETSRQLNENEFVFQTYTYAIENYFCYHESLDSLCVDATKNDKKLIDTSKLVKVYSELIYELFVWSIYLNFNSDSEIFPLSDFCDTIKVLDEADVNEQFQTALEGVKTRVAEKLNLLQTEFADNLQDLEQFKESLTALGVNPKNTYLFARGHTIKDNVVLMFLKPICEVLKKAKRDEIREKAQTPQEKGNQINKYNKECCYKIEDILNNNKEFKSCFLYSKTEEDLVQFIENHHQN